MINTNREYKQISILIRDLGWFNSHAGFSRGGKMAAVVPGSYPHVTKKRASTYSTIKVLFGHDLTKPKQSLQLWIYCVLICLSFSYFPSLNQSIRLYWRKNQSELITEAGGGVNITCIPWIPYKGRRLKCMLGRKLQVLWE